VKQTVTFTVNGAPYEVEVPVNWTLMRLLRDELGLIGTKDGCSQGVCGACTVLLDGAVEGLKRDGKLHRLQQAFMDQGAVQCGFCTPGMLLSSAALLEDNPQPSEDEVREALVGNLCRCTGYTRIVRAVVAAGQDQ
jgi:carbon-monoxide dehydrogenase small subunit